jgi:CheY-like chemotaxis protein
MRHKLETDFSCQVTQCANADVFRQVMQSGQTFDVAVVDLNLPGASDGEILDAVIAERIPAVVFTADFNRDLRERLLQRMLDVGEPPASIEPAPELARGGQREVFEEEIGG